MTGVDFEDKEGVRFSERRRSEFVGWGAVEKEELYRNAVVRSVFYF